MATGRQKPKLLVIVGPTASGKSKLAMGLAKEFNGEIIAADSRTIYKGMDITTAKPTKQDQARVPHHLIDVLEPGQNYSAADFQKQAKKIIKDINARHHLALLVGGSGLYIDGLIFNFKFAPKAQPAYRTKLESMGLDGLNDYAQAHDIFLGGIDRSNKRHIVRAIERGGMVQQTLRLQPHTLVVGLMPAKKVLAERIQKRVDGMIEQGLLSEVREGALKHGSAYEPNGLYSIVNQYDKGSLTLEELKTELVKTHLNLVKKQTTWFKRNSYIEWFGTSQQAQKYVRGKLLNT